MSKRLVALALCVSLLAGCSLSNQERVYQKIDKERVFESKDYEKYVLFSLLGFKSYDLNGDGKEDLFAIFKAKGLLFGYQERASEVMIDKNQTKENLIYYQDLDNDGILEKKSSGMSLDNILESKK
jgi:hypothetical protein